MSLESNAAPVAQWAPSAPRARRRWPWIVVPAVIAVAGLVTASTALIAPGVYAADISIGGLTEDGAVRAINQKLAATTIQLETADGVVEVTGADLGATIDARALAVAARDTSPLWNVSAWGGTSLDGKVVLDEAQALAVLREAVPSAFLDPVDASVSFDGTKYTVTPAQGGTGISVPAIRDALQSALDTGSTTFDATPSEVDARVTTAEAEAAAATLNGAITDAGFYVGEERLVPVDAKTVASWITFTIDDDGAAVISVDQAGIDKLVPGLAKKVDRAVKDTIEYVDRQGNHLEDGAVGVAGRKLDAKADIAGDFAAALAAGNGKFQLPVTVVDAKVKQVVKRIEVSLSEQRVYVYEGDTIIRTFVVSTGLPGTATTPGEWRINSHIVIQDMGCVDGYDYCTKDVPWVMYFNGDEGFHGTWWHNNFGTPMSHGCVNMTIAEAKWLWDWTPLNTEVSVYY